MAFSYSPASTSIIKGDGFYRIIARSIDQNSSGVSAELGPGDLIPIDVGFSGIQVGPESDYENYELIYFDSIGGVQTIPFSTKRPFLGRISAEPGAPYPGANGETQKVYIRIADPSTMNGAIYPGSGAGRIDATFADLIVFTADSPKSLPTSRNPKRRSANTSVLPFVPLFFFIPAYGRRILTVEASVMMIEDVDNSVTMLVDGCRLYQPFVSNAGDTITGPMQGKVLAQTTVTSLLASTALPDTAPVVSPLTEFFPSLSFGYNAELDAKGYFDFFRVTLRSDSTQRPADYYAGMGVHLNMEVRD